MILAKGKVYDSSEQGRILATLEAEINRTRAEKTISTEEVIAALDILGKKLNSGEFDEAINALGIDGISEYAAMAADMLSRGNVTRKVETELGTDYFEEKEIASPYGKIKAKAMPLGTLFHIAAGNVDGLPAYSAAEGLLTGNVNILKLPQADNGLSVNICLKLIEIEPKISDFLYVFDTPSDDVSAMKKMADISDGIIVWGGDAATMAVRRFAKPNVKLIEWGHRLGFAYISGFSDKERELKGLAGHIFSTKQLLCSSCQTIYIDSDSMADVHAFCAEFLPLMDAAAEMLPVREIGAIAESTLRKYNDRLEKYLNGDETVRERKTYQGAKCSLIACEDSELELSYMYGNCLVKRLPKEKLFSVLRATKGYLQTAGLICEEEKRGELTDLLARCGVNRIMTTANMSKTFVGEAHDGEYPLRRYTRTVNIESR